MTYVHNSMILRRLSRLKISAEPRITLRLSREGLQVYSAHQWPYTKFTTMNDNAAKTHPFCSLRIPDSCQISQSDYLGMLPNPILISDTEQIQPRRHITSSSDAIMTTRDTALRICRHQYLHITASQRRELEILLRRADNWSFDSAIGGRRDS